MPEEQIEYLINPEEVEIDSSSDNVLQFSNETKMVGLFVFCILALLGLVFYINKTAPEKDISFSNTDNLPAVNVSGVLGDKSSKSLQKLNPKQGPTQDTTVSNLIPSSEGKITFINESIRQDSSIETYLDDLHVFGDLDINGDLFNLTVFVNNSENISYRVAGVGEGRGVLYDNATTYVADSDDGDHDYSKFHIHITGLNSGENDVRFELYSDPEKSQKLDEISFKVDKKNTISEISEVEITEANTANKADFFESIGATIRDDRLWLNYPPVYDLYQNLKEKDFILEQRFVEYDVSELGSVKIDGSDKKLYRISLFESKDDKGGTYIIGYKDQSSFYYFPNVTRAKINLVGLILNYLKPSKYSLGNSVLELTSISLEKSDDQLYSGDTPRLCSKSDKDKNKKSTHEEFEIKEDFTVVDSYGLCRDFVYDAKYFEKGGFTGLDYLDSKYNDDFGRLSLDLDGFDKEAYYSLINYTCNGKEVRRLEEKYTENLEKVGKTTNDKDVYILNTTTLVFDKPLYSGLVSYNDAKDSDSISDSKWKDLLNSQKDEFPILIIKDAYKDYLIYAKSSNTYVDEKCD